MWEVSRQAGCHLALQHDSLPVADKRGVESEKTREREKSEREKTRVEQTIYSSPHTKTHKLKSRESCCLFIFSLDRPLKISSSDNIL